MPRFSSEMTISKLIHRNKIETDLIFINYDNLYLIDLEGDFIHFIIELNKIITR